MFSLRRSLVYLASALLLVLLVGTGLPVAAAAPGDVVINEIMQNPNAVLDSAGEWFELYNATGADIDINGWTIADAGIDTHVINNGGPLLIPAGGFLVLGNNTDSGTNGGVTVDYNYGSSWFLANGDDEIILSDDTLTEIDRVEYDGGLNFPDPTGASMALADPSLDNNVGANWCEASTPYGNGDLGTPGAANDCLTAAVEVVINEIMQNPAAVADDSGEWFELYNPTAAAIDIDGWMIADNDFDSHVIANGGPLLIPAGGYIVLGNNADSGTNGGVTVHYNYGSSWFLANGADEVVLLDTGLNEIDRIEYDDGATFPDPNGASMALSDPTLDNNVGANWCQSSTPLAGGDFGTPGAANDCAGPVVTVIINEIMQNPNAVSDSAGEWFELHNPTAMAIDINGWTLADNDTDSHVINNGGPLLIPAGGFLVLGNNIDSSTNGGAPVDYSYGGSWFLANGADEVVLFDTSLNEIDRVEYDGGLNFPDPTGASMSLSDPALDNNVGANWCESVTSFGDGDFGTPGAENVCVIVEPPLSCDDTSVITFIHDIQGPGLTSPIAGSTTVIDGVVVGDFQNNASADNGDLNGFYVQEEDADADGNTLTSEGIFVFAPGADDISTGDHVRVKGDVSEFSTSGGASLMTELTNVTIALCATPATMPAATEVTFPVSAVTDLERYEGMLVTFPQALSISEYFNFDRFNEVVLTLGRQYQPTAVAEPGTPANAVAAQNALARITLDDGRSIQNSDPAIHPNGNTFDLTNLFRGGDTVQDTTGVIDNTFGLYRIQPTQAPTYSAENAREVTPADVGGSLTVASFNVLNYFSSIDNGTPICGPAGNQDCRGADNAIEFDRQRTKIIAALADIDADIFGLIELENHATDAALIDLVTGLNDLVGAGTYAYIATGPIGTDAIKVALIYKPATVTPLGSYRILDSSVDPRFLDTLNRPVLAQTFMQNSNGGVLTVAINHLKSKGSDCNDVGDPDIGDGQGNCNQTRLAAAQALVDWLATDPTGSGDLDFIIMGDLNSYDKEDPIDAILAGSDDTAGTSDDYTDLNAAFNGELAYSFVFDGQLGYLDYALSSNTLTAQVTGVTEWHINADEPDILDYNTDFKQPAQQALFEPNAFRSSDHDPVIVGLDLKAYDFSGFFAPLANPPAVNMINAGQTAAVQFSLNGDQGMAIIAAGYPQSQGIDCNSLAPIGSPQPTSTPGNSALTYDPLLDQYTYPWKTEKSWADTCRQFVLVLDDGSVHKLYIHFVK